jgi:GntR family transcriptional repressor for pyruvate dehydrogenase complex
MAFPYLQTHRVTLADQVEAHIRDLIVSERIGPGESLPSSMDLAAEFSVSRSIVRESMRSLQAKGLIEIANGKRARVRPMTNSVLTDFFDRFARTQREAVIDLLELRRGVEVQAAVLAARRRSPEDLALMWPSVHRMGENLGNLDVFLEMDVQLHLTIARASKNQMMFHLVASIREVMRDTMREGLMRHPNEEDWKKNHADHLRLVRLIEEQDEQGAGAFMGLHLDTAMHRIMTQDPVASMPEDANPSEVEG